eukprot:Clim_evm7s9 gene=Clim_evmTU7s9
MSDAESEQFSSLHSDPSAAIDRTQHGQSSPNGVRRVSQRCVPSNGSGSPKLEPSPQVLPMETSLQGRDLDTLLTAVRPRAVRPTGYQTPAAVNETINVFAMPSFVANVDVSTNSTGKNLMAQLQKLQESEDVPETSKNAGAGTSSVTAATSTPGPHPPPASSWQQRDSQQQHCPQSDGAKGKEVSTRNVCVEGPRNKAAASSVPVEQEPTAARAGTQRMVSSEPLEPSDQIKGQQKVTAAEHLQSVLRGETVSLRPTIQEPGQPNPQRPSTSVPNPDPQRQRMQQQQFPSRQEQTQNLKQGNLPDPTTPFKSPVSTSSVSTAEGPSSRLNNRKRKCGNAQGPPRKHPRIIASRGSMSFMKSMTLHSQMMQAMEQLRQRASGTDKGRPTLSLNGVIYGRPATSDSEVSSTDDEKRVVYHCGNCNQPYSLPKSVGMVEPMGPIICPFCYSPDLSKSLQWAAMTALSQQQRFGSVTGMAMPYWQFGQMASMPSLGVVSKAADVQSKSSMLNTESPTCMLMASPQMVCPGAPMTQSYFPMTMQQAVCKPINCPCCGLQLQFPVTMPTYPCNTCASIVHNPLMLDPTNVIGFKTPQYQHMTVDLIKTLKFCAGRDYSKLLRSIRDTFASTDYLSVSFLKEDVQNVTFVSMCDSGVSMKDVSEGYRLILDELPEFIGQAMMEAMRENLVNDTRIKDGYQLRRFLVMLECPILDKPKHLITFSHLVGLIANSSHEIHRTLVSWIKDYDESRSRNCVYRILNLLQNVLFDHMSRQSRPILQQDWRVVSATKVLAIFNAANRMKNYRIIPIEDFYNEALDHIDMISDYDLWQSGHRGFTFCQHSFTLSMNWKMKIFQVDARRQMERAANDAYMSTIVNGVQMDPYLTLVIRREHLIEDSLTQIAVRLNDVKKRVHIRFEDEPGIDMGGLTKEWFLLLVREVFNPQYGMFEWDEESGYVWFDQRSTKPPQTYRLLGIVMGLAIYNSIILDLHFPLACFKKLLDMPVSLYDLKDCKPSLGRGLQQLLDYEGDDLDETFDLNFSVSVKDTDGRVKDVELMENGCTTVVTSKNRDDYVRLMVNYHLNEATHRQFGAFYRGFHRVCGGNGLSLFHPQELERLVCGSDELNFEELRSGVDYEGFHESDPYITGFWDIVLNWDTTMKKKFLLFCTGSDRVPLGGMKEMNFKISNLGTDCERLPISHTCFNQLCIFHYSSKQKLKDKMEYAIANSEGYFGLR